jgi:16S rRNA (uracil1498-N3)-methyltransferase
LVESLEAGRVALAPDDVHHLVRVLRAEPGREFVALDGRGGVSLCRLRRDTEGWFGLVLKRLEENPESPLRVCLGQSLIKKDRFEWVVQKAVELGVTEIAPLICRRTEVLLEAEGLAHRMRRWRKIVLEAFRQSGRTRLPELHEPVDLEALVTGASAELRFALDEREGIHLRSLWRGQVPPRSCLFLVGPEGGWDDSDRRIFEAHRIPAVNLGLRILRAETAPVAALSILQYEFGNLGPV